MGCLYRIIPIHKKELQGEQPALANPVPPCYGSALERGSEVAFSKQVVPDIFFFFLFFSFFSFFVLVDCINIRAWRLHHGLMLLPSKS